jgi:polyketide synthase 7
LWLGSIKSNIGHTQAAAGVAGVIKMLMAMRHGVLPKSLHIGEPTPHVDWSAGAVELLTEAREWPQAERPRRAAVSSFGISGTNAHVILEQPPAESEARPVGVQLPVLVSAKSPAALAARAGQVRGLLEEGADAADLAAALATRVPQLPYRAAVSGADRSELMAGLSALAGGEPAADLLQGVATAPGKTVFVFPGQGSQWEGMALGLLESSQVFAEQLAACAEALAPYTDWSLLDVLRGVDGAPGLDRVDVVQPALWAVMVSLARLWQSVGVRPDAVMGHSQGEIAAACVAGALSLEDAAKVVALRSRAIVRLAGTGGMVSVALPAAEVRELIAGHGDAIDIAAHNGPFSTVVSGNPEALAALVARCEAEGVRARTIPVDYASHSSHVDLLEDELRTLLADLAPHAADIIFCSTVTGEPLAGEELDGAYWYRNLRRTVQLEEATRTLLAQGHRQFIEISPHPVLTSAIGDTADEAGVDDVAAVESFRRDDGGLDRFLASAGKAYARGVTVDWAAVLGGPAAAVDLPTYPFQRRRHWLTGTTGGGDATAFGLREVRHPLLGAAIRAADTETLIFTGRLSRSTQPWLDEHAALGTVLLPGSALVELAVQAGDRAGCSQIEELVLEAPVTFGDTGDRDIQVLLGAPDEDGRRQVGIHSRPSGDDGDWVRHAAGTLTAVAPEPSSDPVAWPPPGAEPLPVENFYEGLAARGYHYGPTFQGVRAAWQAGTDVYAEVRLADEVEDSGFTLHPALLDAALHAVSLVGEADQVRLPFSWAGVALHAAGARSVRVRLTQTGADTISVLIADETGAPVATVDALTVRAVDPDRLSADRPERQALFEPATVAAEPAEAPAGERWALLGSDLAELDDVLAEADIAPTRYADVSELAAAGGAPPERVLWCVPAGGAGVPDSALALAVDTLAVLQRWLAAPASTGARLTVVTRTGDLAHAALSGLIRTARTENPGRVQLLSLDGHPDSLRAVPTAAAAGPSEVLLRSGALLTPALARTTGAAELVPPSGREPWRLSLTIRGELDSLSLTACPDVLEPLGAGQVRVAVRAGGLNFRDVLLALGMVPDDERPPVGEGAGVVLAVGPDVTGFAPGDQVMGLFSSGIGPVAVTDHRLIAAMPKGLTFAQAAGIPVVYLTAYYGLADLAGLRSGESLLVHAATGGVGIAAVQLARHWGVEVYGTASPGKWDTLRAMGFTDDHIANSRTLEFEERFRSATDGRGVDVVLNSLAREYVDASLRLLPRGGRFLEMGKTDIRDPKEVADGRPGVRYQAFDVLDAGADRIGRMLDEIRALFDEGALSPMPISAWDIRRAPEAFRHLSQARHIGKVILTVPSRPDPEGTVLVTGGTGVLGSLVARHLVAEHGVRRLLLLSRRGAQATGAAALRAELRDAGAEVTVAAADAADGEALAEVLAAIPAEHPLTGVVHAAGMIDDGTLESLTPERLATVFRAKVDAAWHLHRLTKDLDLSFFVLFSSLAGTLGNAGQGGYAGANTFLDGLAAHRAALGLPATSIAWGLWARTSEMTGHLDEARLRRLELMGMAALTDDHGLALFDAVLDSPRTFAVAAPVDMARLRASGQPLPELLAGLDAPTGGPARRRVVEAGPSGAGSLADRLAALPGPQQDKALLDLVRGAVATVLGHANAQEVTADRAFKELGFDSLTAVELRNRLNNATGLRLPATLVFDHPTPEALARFLRAQVVPQRQTTAESLAAELDGLQPDLLDAAARQLLTDRMRDLLNRLDGHAGAVPDEDRDLESATDDEIFDFIDSELGSA